jgi:glycosyltransferase involved in cell wall biosynthesis
MKTLSVCITCYDQDYYLLDNLLNVFSKQTEKPNKIIISSSGLNEIKLMNYGFEIILINSPTRHNQAVARNKAIKLCDTDLLMFFDVDDIPHPQKIKITKKIFQNNSLDALVHNYNLNLDVFEDINSIPEIIDVKEKNPHNTNVMYGNYPIHHAHITISKNIISSLKFKEDSTFYRKEDGKFCQDIIDFNFKLKYVNLKLVNYKA